MSIFQLFLVSKQRDNTRTNRNQDHSKLYSDKAIPFEKRFQALDFLVRLPASFKLTANIRCSGDVDGVSHLGGMLLCLLVNLVLTK